MCIKNKIRADSVHPKMISLAGLKGTKKGASNELALCEPGCF